MKKVLVLVVGVLLLTGCGSKETYKHMKCSRTVNQSSIQMDLEYDVTYKGKYVTNIESVEKIYSSNEVVLNTYKTQLENLTKSYNDIKYYDHKITVSDDSLTSTISINYEKIDTDKLIKLDSSLKQLIKDGKVALTDVEKTYASMGVICEK